MDLIIGGGRMLSWHHKSNLRGADEVHVFLVGEWGCIIQVRVVQTATGLDSNRGTRGLTE